MPTRRGYTQVRDLNDPASWQRAGYTVHVSFLPADTDDPIEPDDVQDHVHVRIHTHTYDPNPPQDTLIAEGTGMSLTSAMANLTPAPPMPEPWPEQPDQEPPF